MTELRLPDRPLAITAFILGITAVWLPWWRVRYVSTDGTVYEGVSVRLFAPAEPYTTSWGPHATGAGLLLLLLWLFVRTAGASHRYEPRAWRRDLGLLTLLSALLVASAFLWPLDLPHFWGTRDFSDGVERFREDARPVLGWWLQAAASLALLGAWRTSRHRVEEPDGAEPEAAK